MSSSRSSLVRRTAESRGAPERSARSNRSTPRTSADVFDEAGFLSLTPERARVLLLVAARPTTYALVAVVVLMLAALLSSGSNLAGTSGAIAAGWLAAHQVPLVIGKTSLELLPLLPTGLLVWATGRDCARAVEPDSSRADLGWIVGAALSGPLLVTAVCLAVAEDASGVVALQPPNTLAAFGWVGAVHLIAAVGGIASRSRRRLFTLLRLPDWAVAGAFGAGRTVLRLLTCATAVVIVSFLAHWSRIGDTFHTAGNAAGVLGLILLSLAYLPNVVIATVGVLVGSGAQFGDASIGVFSVVGGPIPAVPLMAAVPTGPAEGWWPVLLLLPAAVGVLGGLDIGRTSHDRAAAPWATLTSAGVATVTLVLLGVVAGGDLGTFGQFGLDLPIFAVVAFGWLAVTGYVGLVFARWVVVPIGAPVTGYDDEYTDYEDDYYDDDYYEDRDHYDDHYEDEHYDEYDDYDDEYAGPEFEVELDGELVDEQPAIATSGAAGSNTFPDIVDAEVVEADLPESDRMDGR
ncbi:cell division protein PerM [Nocardia sp. CA-120079]|uniref:cell division protein PerM n=1 Tax=Nocardia sp. CA-120079 TaxID=3239974 RepID=UPI003D95492A